MTTADARWRAFWWWPPIGILAMVVLGLAVGDGSTGVDDWVGRFGAAHPAVIGLLWLTKPLLLQCMLAVAVGIALYRRRWRLAAVVAVTPLVAVVAERVLKRLFGREREGALAYPSGHVTVMLVVLGMVLLVFGMRKWMVVVAGVYALAALAGPALTFHYFTDAIGAVFLGTSVVVLAAWAAGLDRCQPRCDLDHSGG